MGSAVRKSVTVITDSNGDATAFTPGSVLSGRFSAMSYVKDDYDDGSTFTITTDTTLQPILTETAINASAVRAPRQATHGVTGTASTYDDVGSNPVEDHIVLAGERIKIVISNGGSVKSGTFHFIVE